MSGGADHYDIAIVGGGMVGLTLAQLFSHCLPGASLIILDSYSISGEAKQTRQPSFDTRSTALSAGSVEILQTIGLWKKISSAATPILKVHVSDRGSLGAASYSSEQDVGPLGYVVENQRFGEQLALGVLESENITVLAPATVGNIFPEHGGVRIEGNMPRQSDLQKNNDDMFTFHSDLVVLAGGTSSQLQKKLGLLSEVVDYQQHAIVANVAYEYHHEGVAYERFTDDGPLALLPLGNDINASRSALVFTHKDDQIDSVMGLSDEDFLARLQERFGYRLGYFTQLGKRVSYPLKLVLAKEQVRSSIVLMGNAAHFLHPVAGQGFNLAMRDCASLVSTIKNERSKRNCRYGDIASLNKYVESQYVDQTSTVHLSHSFNALFSSSRVSKKIVRNMGLIGMELSQDLKSHFFRQMMGLGGSSPNLS